MWNQDGVKRFKNFIKGLAKEQGIKDNLKEIFISGLCISNQDAMNIILENGLHNTHLFVY